MSTAVCIIFILYILTGDIWQVVFLAQSNKELMDILRARCPNTKDKNIKKAITIARIMVATFWPYYFIKETIVIFRKGNK